MAERGLRTTVRVLYVSGKPMNRPSAERKGADMTRTKPVTITNIPTDKPQTLVEYDLDTIETDPDLLLSQVVPGSAS